MNAFTAGKERKVMIASQAIFQALSVIPLGLDIRPPGFVDVMAFTSAKDMEFLLAALVAFGSPSYCFAPEFISSRGPKVIPVSRSAK